jgi:hypothetical protein
MNVTVTGLDRIIDRVNRMGNMRERCAEVARRLCEEVGEPIIRATHQVGLAEQDHVGAVVVSEPTDNGYLIRASGEKVLFVEFGTGDMAGAMSANYDAVPASVAPGTWSATHSQQYSNNQFWIHAGQRYEFTEPHPAFYEAYQAMVTELPRIAREVFAA